ncbi:ovomucoid-like [Ochotona princeps]|uniref:ovomucoid-like n=1 Tax=Ochotona princeps TaxID=9978 RepID=UPI00271468E3|nr:ovomucoid-like [Ochotona princeps]XP_058533622.1 ovomucoid-like [Ochotona princeps]
MPFFSPWITAVFIISLTFPFHSETSFESPARRPPSCDMAAYSACSEQHDPVCASNGRTYGNSCKYCRALKLTNAFWYKHYGEC